MSILTPVTSPRVSRSESEDKTEKRNRFIRSVVKKERDSGGAASPLSQITPERQKYIQSIVRREKEKDVGAESPSTPSPSTPLTALASAGILALLDLFSSRFKSQHLPTVWYVCLTTFINSLFLYL
jgi:hypothetical protein